jgi:NADH-quinone oxidoreductase subunit C
VTPLELNPKQAAVQIEPQIVVPLFEFLLAEPALKFNLLSSISGIDASYNIDLVYFVSSLEFKHKLAIRTKVDRTGGKIDTISNVLPAANWFEREIWELYGVDFIGHPDLRRFLLPEDWNEGHPMLRDWTGKDFVKMPEVTG